MRSRSAPLVAVAALVVGATALAGCGDTGADSAADRMNNKPNATADKDSGWPAEEVAHGQAELRAVVTEEGSGAVRVIDLASGETVDTLDVEGQARLVRTEDQTHVVLAQSEEDMTHVVDAGIRWVDHGGHADPAHVAPAVAGQVEAANPVHVVPHGDHVTIFADDEGKGHVVHLDEPEADEHAEHDHEGAADEPDTDEHADDHAEGEHTDDHAEGEHAEAGGELAVERVLNTGRPHHGVAVALEDGEMIGSLPDKDKEETLPMGVQIFDENNQPTQTFDNCPGLHGEYAASDEKVILGCEDGVLVLEKAGDKWEASKIENPADAKPEERVGAFVGEEDEAIMGTFGDNAVVAVDLAAEKMQRIALPDVQAAYIWDPYWDQGVVLTADGNLHGVDVESGKLVNTSKVTEPFEMSDDWTKARPSIATGEKAIYLTDPYSNKMIEAEISRDGFDVSRTMKLDYEPFSIAVLGMFDD